MHYGLKSCSDNSLLNNRFTDLQDNLVNQACIG